MDFEQILEQLAQKYAHCETYQDSGRVEGGMGLMTFRTYFVRPNRFRFEWIDLGESAQNCIWTNGNKVYARFSSSEEVEEENDISSAIAGATGVSQGVAHSIPTLLLPDISASIDSFTLLKQFSDIVSCENDSLGGVGCYKAISIEQNRHDELWIRSTDLAVLRLREERTSTPEDDEFTINTVREHDPAEAEEMRRFLESQTEEDRRSVSTAFYEIVHFDAPIDEALFKPLF